MTATFPAGLTVVKATRPQRRNQSTGGGPGADGTEQKVVGPGGGIWAWSLTVVIRTRDDVLDLGAFVEQMDGTAGTAIVPICDGPRAPWAVDPLTGGLITPAKAAASAAIDAAFATNPDTSGALTFTLAADASVNAASIGITRTHGGLIRPGMFFSIGSELHAIAALDSPDAGATSTRTATIRPWLRASHAAGDAIEFGNPICLARFAADDTGRLDLDLLRFGQASLDFVEAF